MRSFPIVAWLAALLLLTPVASQADGALVIIGGFQLNPRSVTLEAGQELTFQVQAHEDAMLPHVVVGEGGAFRSPPLEAGERWTLVLNEPGVYRYRLAERDSVEGVIVVR